MLTLKLNLVWVTIVFFPYCMLGLNTSLRNISLVVKKPLFDKIPRIFGISFEKNQSSWDIPRNISFNHLTGSTEQEFVNFFASYFNSVYSSSTINTNFRSLCIPFFNFPKDVFFSTADVLLRLSSFQALSSVGPDDIPGDFLF